MESPLVADNLAFLQQGRDLLGRLPGELYRMRPPAGSPVGEHLRHCLDFYQCFLDGRSTGRVDYDARRRDPRVESDPQYAQQCIDEICTALRQLPLSAGASALLVAVDRDCECEELEPFGASSVRRELQFLRSHTVHHYALIATTLKLLGFDPGENLGVAPSTLAHRRQTLGAG